MVAGQYNFTGTQSLVQGKTLRRRFKFTDAAGAPLPVTDYQWRAAFKKDLDSAQIFFMCDDPLVESSDGCSIELEPDGEEGTIELVITDEAMGAISHTAWTEKQFTGAPSKYQGIWELEAEELAGNEDTLPMLAGKVNFIREVVTQP